MWNYVINLRAVMKMMMKKVASIIEKVGKDFEWNPTQRAMTLNVIFL